MKNRTKRMKMSQIVKMVYERKKMSINLDKMSESK